MVRVQKNINQNEPQITQTEQEKAIEQMKEYLMGPQINKLPDYNREMANDICDYLIGQRNLSHSEQNAERLLRPQRIRQFTTYFECKDPDCGYREKEFIKISKREKRIRPIIEEMVKCLLEDEEDIETLPLVNFPELAGDSGGICADVAHESAHVPTVAYIDIFDTTGARFTTGFSKKKYKEWFGYDLETFKNDPYEDN
ncbi:2366_t:CDS:2 [Entrophospora sp. SA101]|nr:2366_t:CDS:2 [Entrophospora sp. SA101]